MRKLFRLATIMIKIKHYKHPMKKLTYVIGLTITALLIACSIQPSDPIYQPSTYLPVFKQASFNEYISETKNWLTQNRVFLSENIVNEVEVNAPYEMRPRNKPQKGILLVHGLGDSPYSFTDISQTLKSEDILVRTILLPGHGSKPADLILPTLKRLASNCQSPCSTDGKRS